MPNTKKEDSNSINASDKDTLHNAGVDVSPLVGEPEDQEGKEEVIVDIDGGTPTPSDPDLKKTGIRFFDENKPVNKEDLSALAEKKLKEVTDAGSDLEAEFKKELNSSSSSETTKVIQEKSGTMAGLLDKIRDKLGLKKNKVKEELSSLKKMKDGISKDIADIKELEESEQKIKAEIEKVDSIKEEMANLEREVGEELKK